MPDFGNMGRLLARRPGSRRLRLFLRLARLLALTLAIALCAGIWLVQKNATAIARHYLDSLGAASGMDIRVEAVELSFSPLPGLSLVRPGISGASFTCGAALAMLRPRLWPLLRGRLEPAAILLLRPRLSAVFTGRSGSGSAASPPNLRQALAPVATLLADYLPAGSRLELSQGDVELLFRGQGRNGLLMAGNVSLTLESGGQASLGAQCRASSLRWLEGGHPLFTAAALRLDAQADLGNPLLGPGSVFASADISLPGLASWPGARLGLQSRNGGWNMQLHLDGHLLREGMRIGQGLDARLTLPAEATELELKSCQWHLDADSGDLALRLTLPEQAASFVRALAGLPALEEGKPWAVAGELAFRRLSLTQWLGFARMLNPGLQQTLDNLTDGQLAFSLDAQGLSVPRASASCTGSRFEGFGGVPSWQEPVVEISMLTDRASLGLAIPEALGNAPVAPRFFYPPLTPVPDQPLKPGESPIGYHVVIGAKRLDYGPIWLGGVKVVISPGKADGSGERPVIIAADGSLYGGSAQGRCELGSGENLPCAISGQASGVSARKLGADLEALPLKSGTMKLDLAINSSGRTLKAFLDRLRGQAALKAESGEIRLPGGKDGLAFSEADLKLALAGGSYASRRLTLAGQWDLAMRGNGFSLKLRENGPLRFGGAELLSCQQLPGRLDFRADSTLTGLGRELSGSCEGRLSLRGGLKASLEQARIRAGGLSIEGSFQTGSANGSLTAEGHAALNAPDLGASLKALGFAAPAFATKCRLAGEGDFSLAQGEIRLSRFKGSGRGLSASGDLSFFWAGARPRLDFSLTMPDLDLDSLNQKKQGDDKSSLDFPLLRKFDAQGTLQIKKIRAWKLRATDLRLPFRLNAGKCSVEPVEAHFYGANLHAALQLDFTRGILFGNKLSVRKFSLKNLAGDIEPGMQLGGMMSLDAATHGLLMNSGQVPGALFGKWDVDVSDGSYLAQGGKGQPFTFSLASASGEINKGVLRSSNFLLRGKDLEIRGGGWLNLANRQLDGNFNINMKNLPDIPLHLSGSIGNSKTSIGAGQLILNTIGGVAKGFVDTLGGVARGAIELFR